MSEKKFFGMLTEIGEIKEANAIALGVRRRITEMGVCDGNGVEFLPDRKMRELPGLKRRAALNSLTPDDNNPAWVIAEQVIPETEGGFWIRGYGLYDEDGDLVAVANCPPSYKPVLAEGSGKTQTVRMVLMVGSVATYELKIDPAVVLATREYVDKEAAKKLGKSETAEAAKKLANARKISISGAGEADGVDFDGTKDISLALKNLNMDKATAGTLPVARGGTGAAIAALDAFLLGNGTNPLQQLTPEQARVKIGAAKSTDVLPVASIAEAQAMTSDVTLLTPRKLVDAFKLGQVLAGINMNQPLPGGAIIKTGVYYQGSASSQNFATPFPNVCAAVVGAESAVPAGQAGYVVVQFGGVTREGFNAQMRTMDGLFPNAATVRYIAIGY